jgi:MFS family permease
VVFGVFALGAATQVAVFRFNSRRVVLAGLGLFLVALVLVVVGIGQAALGLFLAGTCISGVALGAVFLGSLTTVNRLAPPQRRAQVVSTFFVAAYLGLIIPVVGVGILSRFIGIFWAVFTLAIILAAMCLFSLARTATATQLEAAAQ